MDIEKIKKNVMDVVQYLCIGAALTIGWVLNEKTYEWRHKVEKVNPYTNIYSPKQISVAIDETENLLLIMKSTGEYTAFNDSIGQAIFKIYAKRIYNEVKTEETKK